MLWFYFTAYYTSADAKSLRINFSIEQWVVIGTSFDSSPFKFHHLSKIFSNFSLNLLSSPVAYRSACPLYLMPNTWYFPAEILDFRGNFGFTKTDLPPCPTRRWWTSPQHPDIFLSSSQTAWATPNTSRRPPLLYWRALPLPLSPCRPHVPQGHAATTTSNPDAFAGRGDMPGSMGRHLDSNSPAQPHRGLRSHPMAEWLHGA